MEQPTLGAKDKEELLRIARTSIEATARRQRMPKLDTNSPFLQEQHGAFVTLYEHGELRGCIGFIAGLDNLAETVQESAIKAAFEDPRFYSVFAQELRELTIEVSVLSPLSRVTKPEEIIIGTHGLVIEGAGRRGLLLPKVASENDFDARTFLEETSLKAGGPKDLWKRPGTKISVFTAEVFSEQGPTPNA
jgi:AmmeMemoRadiSam system protein A